jgi:hypothetical protein
MYCKKFMANYRRILSKIDKQIEQFLPIVATVAGTLKTALDSGIVRTLVDLTPATWDNVLRVQVVKILDCSLREFRIVTDNLNKDNSINFPRLLVQLDNVSKVEKDNLIFKVSALMLAALHGKKLKQSEYDLFMQGNYTASLAA